MGGDANSDPAAVLAREDALTGDETVPHQILIHAPTGLPVDSEPLGLGVCPSIRFCRRKSLLANDLL